MPRYNYTRAKYIFIMSTYTRGEYCLTIPTIVKLVPELNIYLAIPTYSYTTDKYIFNQFILVPELNIF